MSEDSHTLRADGITATVLAHGAELCSLRNEQGLELLWQAGPQWPRHAPLLFPIVGRLKNDELRHRGKIYRMTQHGFARDQRFEWVERGPSSCSLVLGDNAATRAGYPFAFRLMVTYQVQQADLDVTMEITNAGGEMLPASIGAHPAFNWPLLSGSAKENYALTFSNEEPAPIHGKRLALSERLFDDDAVIVDLPTSRSVRYMADKGPSLEISREGFRELGIWSKPGGAPFLCIEPWRGFASPADFDGEFSDKTGVMQIAPGAMEVVKYRTAIR